MTAITRYASPGDSRYDDCCLELDNLNPLDKKQIPFYKIIYRLCILHGILRPFADSLVSVSTILYLFSLLFKLIVANF